MPFAARLPPLANSVRMMPRVAVRRMSTLRPVQPGPGVFLSKRTANRAFMSLVIEAEENEQAAEGQCVVRAMANDHMRTAVRKATQAEALIRHGRQAEAETPAMEALRFTRSLASNVVEVNGLSGVASKALSTLVTSYAAQGKLSNAEPYARELMERNLSTLGIMHPVTIQAQMILASLLGSLGKFRDAAELLRRTEAACKDAYGVDHAATRQVARRLHEAESNTSTVSTWRDNIWLDRFFATPTTAAK